MSNESTFSYTYSAKENQEVLNIRKKYMPHEETKLEELKRLDNLVQSSGVMESLCVGIVGALVFGFGFCLTMKIIGNTLLLGVILELIGAVSMIFAYPVYRKLFEKAKNEHKHRILELSAELTGNI